MTYGNGDKSPLADCSLSLQFNLVYNESLGPGVIADGFSFNNESNCTPTIQFSYRKRSR
jgi:hypothetical protein